MDTTLIQTEEFRVMARLDTCPVPPEGDYVNAVLLSWGGRYGGYMAAEPVLGALDDVERLEYAANALDDDDVFTRYAAIFHGLYVSKAHGYTQGDVYLVVSDDPDMSAEECELVNWARGDVYTLELCRREEWTNPRGEVRYEWEVLDTVGGYFTANPETLKSVAAELLGEHN